MSDALTLNARDLAEEAAAALSAAETEAALAQTKANQFQGWLTQCQPGHQ